MVNVAVIGCGVIGLTTALAIQEKLKNVDVTIYAKDVSPNTTSDIAAGLLEPYLLKGTPEEKVIKWFRATFDYTRKLWKEGKACEAGISLLPVIQISDKSVYKLPDWAKYAMGFSVLSSSHLETLSKQFNKELSGGFSFVTFTWEATTFLPFLQQQFIDNGGRIIKKEIRDFRHLAEYDCIVNCTGLQARELTGDTRLKPIRGQIVRVNAPWQFTILMFESEENNYIIPNINCVILGGTSQEKFNLMVDETDKNNILRNCTKLLPAIKSAEIIKHQVGLRPGRDKVRLEIEIKGSGKNGLRIVHNYGHGGSGITVSVGCAQEAAKLVEEVLKDQISYKSKL